MPPSFLNQLSRPRPDPGGGAAAAFGGMLALALLEKVAQLEMQRPANKEKRQEWEEKLVRIRQLTGDLDRLREEDVRAYAQMTEARGSGSSSPEFQEAVEHGLEVPREIMARAWEALSLVAWAGVRCQKHLLSDLQVAREFLMAAGQGAYHIARANLPLLAQEVRQQGFSRILQRDADKGRKAYQDAGEVLAGR